MIYFDTAYVAKCYLNEPGAQEVRSLAGGADGLGSCEWARVEFASVLHRHLREGHLTRRHVREIMAWFADDENTGVWTWFPATRELLERTVESFGRMPQKLFLRAADALHLTCAKENGFEEIYSNDRHLLACAHHFGLTPLDILET